MDLLLKNIGLPKENEIYEIQVYPDGEVIVSKKLDSSNSTPICTKAKEIGLHGDCVDRDEMIRYIKKVLQIYDKEKDHYIYQRNKDMMYLLEKENVVLEANK